ncbi:MAG: tyrosine-type recombinase/integrase [Clostridia bacterium]|nr:tyrosine-type recombinase/integrase [Clostridia bacterium]
MEEIETGEPLAQLARLFKVTLFTGMREGEVCGLSWDAVNFRDGVITVKQQLQKGKEKGSPHYIAATKNDRVRTITVAPFVMSVLQEQFKEQRKEHLCRAPSAEGG